MESGKKETGKKKTVGCRCRKTGVVLISTALLSLLYGCSTHGAETGSKYTPEYIWETAGITMEGKLLQVENNSAGMYEYGTTGLFYMEIQKRDGNYSIGYNIGGYEIGLFCEDGQQLAFLTMSNGQQEFYEVDGDVSGSVPLSDYGLIGQIMDINYESAAVEVLNLAETTSERETGDTGETEIKEDVVALYDGEFEYILYLDPDSGKCSRLQALEYDEEGELSEVFFILLEDIPQDRTLCPEALKKAEPFEEITGDDFDTLSESFLFSAIANAYVSTENQAAAPLENNGEGTP